MHLGWSDFRYFLSAVPMLWAPLIVGGLLLPLGFVEAVRGRGGRKKRQPWELDEAELEGLPEAPADDPPPSPRALLGWGAVVTVAATFFVGQMALGSLGTLAASHGPQARKALLVPMALPLLLIPLAIVTVVALFAALRPAWRAGPQRMSLVMLGDTSLTALLLWVGVLSWRAARDAGEVMPVMDVGRYVPAIVEHLDLPLWTLLLFAGLGGLGCGLLAAGSGWARSTNASLRIGIPLALIAVGGVTALWTLLGTP